MLKKKTIIKLTVVLLLLIFRNPVTAQSCHGSGSGGHAHSQSNSETPLAVSKGGMVKYAGHFRIEMAVNMVYIEDRISVYMIKKSGKIVPTDRISGTIRFLKENENETIIPLVARNEETLVAQLEGNETFKCEVILTYKTKVYKAIFEYNDPNNSVLSAYSCPMHPAIVSESPDNCPICGMRLTKNK